MERAVGCYLWEPRGTTLSLCLFSMDSQGQLMHVMTMLMRMMMSTMAVAEGGWSPFFCCHRRLVVVVVRRSRSLSLLLDYQYASHSSSTCSHKRSNAH